MTQQGRHRSASPVLSAANCIRVFPRRTSATPDDALVFIGDVPLIRPDDMPVRVSVTFTWDKAEGERLARSWGRFYSDVQLGGPAFDDRGDEFTPGLYVKWGYVVTSRGCPRRCDFCFVPRREGRLRELEVKPGHDVLDNNLLACSRPHIEAVVQMLSRQDQPARFSGGLDARLLAAWHVELLKGLRIQCLWLAYDAAPLSDSVRTAVAMLRTAGFSQRQVGCYVLIGHGDETIAAAEMRLRFVQECGATPWAMLYRDDNGTKPSREWRRFQRLWCRPAAIFGRIASESAQHELHASQG